MVIKFKAIYKESSSSNEHVIDVCNNRDDAVNACVNYRGNYCLDNKQDRIDALSTRDFYILGCGPEEFLIREVEE